MKKTTLEKVLWALEDLTYEVKIDNGIIQRAQKSIQAMLDLS
jgi:quinolinate synthase